MFLDGITTTQLLAIPDGKLGTLATLKWMRKLANDYKKSWPIRELALKLTRRLPQKDFMGEVAVLHKFVRDRIRYVKDIRGVETLATPVKTLELGQGDCDDKATLFAALAESLGIPTRFVAMQFNSNGFSHVYAEANIKGKWIPVETTEPWPLGKKAPGAINRLVMYN